MGKKGHESYQMAPVFAKGGELLTKPFEDFSGDSSAKHQPATTTTGFDIHVKPMKRKLNLIRPKVVQQKQRREESEPDEQSPWRRLKGLREVVGLVLKLERTSPLIPEGFEGS